MNNSTLWYTQSANENYDGWERQALPIGNGFIGAKIFGGIQKEIIQFNEKSLWTGGPGTENYNFGNGDGKNGENVKKLQQILASGDYKAAADAMKLLQGNENGYGSYQNFGNIEIEFSFSEKAENYCRYLDMEVAEAGVDFVENKNKISRRYFVSYPDNCFAARLQNSEEGSLSFVLSYNPAQKAEICSDGEFLVMSGVLPDNSLQFASVLTVVADGGEVKCKNGKIEVHNADSAVIIMSAATDYENKYPTYRNGKKPVDEAKNAVKKAAEKGFDALYKSHIEDYKALFDKLSISIGDEKNDIPTDVLMKNYRSGKASALIETLYFQYGRFLMISSSRPDTLPANLQGVWNGKNNPAWSSDYHFNINLQMNYWISCVANISETFLPLIDYIEALVPAGRVTAQEYYDIDRGFLFNTQNNIFGNTGPGSDWKWGWAPALSAWIMHNLYEYYLFTDDGEILRKRIYPLLEELSYFWSKALVEDKKSGRLVSSPTFSPEHGPVTAGNTFEQEIIRQLFSNTIDASQNLTALGFENEISGDLIEKLKEIMPCLKPINIGKWGQIKEWYDEDEWKKRGFHTMGVEKNHRHISQLLALYPDNYITENTPEYEAAARISLSDRRDFGLSLKRFDYTVEKGWSKAWKTACYARLHDGETAYETYNRLISKSVYDNLWDTHPPFQIDGNFGGTAAVCEMLIQSHSGYIEFLPALPKFWKSGSVSGIMARKAFECDIEWENSQIKNVRVKSLKGNNCIIKTDGFNITKITDKNGNNVDFSAENGKVSFHTTENEEYAIS